MGEPPDSALPLGDHKEAPSVWGEGTLPSLCDLSTLTPLSQAHCQLLDEHWHLSLVPGTPLASLFLWLGASSSDLWVNITSSERPAQGFPPPSWVCCQTSHLPQPAGSWKKGRLGCNDQGEFIPDGKFWRNHQEPCVAADPGRWREALSRPLRGGDIYPEI